MKRILAVIVSAVITLVLSVPASAVFNEEDIGQTLSVLRYELGHEYENRWNLDKIFLGSDDSQHQRVINIIKKCNELSLILYSQNQDYTFDMTYALKEVTSEYDNYSRDRIPYDKVIQRTDDEIRRLELLVSSLEFLDDSDSDRDTCLFYARNLLDFYKDTRVKIKAESVYYDEVRERLQESYDYAQDRYKSIRESIFIDGQDDYFTILSNFRYYVRSATFAVLSKYGFMEGDWDREVLPSSQWEGRTVFKFMGVMVVLLLFSFCLGAGIMGMAKRRLKFFSQEANRRRIPGLRFVLGVSILLPAILVTTKFITGHFYIMACNLMMAYLWLLLSIILSLSIRTDTTNISSGMKVYLPNFILGFIIIFFRITFIPNVATNLLFPPLLLGFTVWQLSVCLKTRKKLDNIDSVLGWITFALMAAITVASLAGYVLMGVLVIIWWLFQLAAIASVLVLSEIASLYKKHRIDPYVEKYSDEVTVPGMVAGRHIKDTWFFDFVHMVFVPVISILTIPQCLWEAADIFDLTSILTNKLYEPFFDVVTSDGSTILRISIVKIVLSVSLYFVFKYLNYLLRSVYALLSINKAKKQSGRNLVKENEVNLTLSSNVIAILIWGTYISTLVILLKIPVGAISIIAAGLATGLGLAMKDVLNNFIYAIQLMSGRLRVGDYIECDGIRGKVCAISYQSTQLETVDGAVMSFLNTDLFSRNFKNLTRNNDYEFLKVFVGVAYGTDVDKARTVILAALREVQESKDKFGRTMVDLDNEISVVVEELADSSVNLAVRQYVLVSEKNIYRVKAQECIYKALAVAGIEIPFPQLDIHNKC